VREQCVSKGRFVYRFLLLFYRLILFSICYLGSTPLLEAVFANDEIKTAMLINAGAKILASNNGGETGLHISAMKGNTSIMKVCHSYT